MEVITRKYYADIVDAWIGKGNIVAIVSRGELDADSV